MKLAVAFVVLLAGAFALPQAPVSRQLATLENAIITRQDERFIDTIIVGIIQGVIDNIQESGMDPVHIDKHHVSKELVDGLTLFIGGEELLISGFSGIDINRVSYSMFVLNVDLSVRRVRLSLGRGYAGVNIGGTVLDGELSGDVAIIQPRITARARIGLVGGIQIRELTTAISLEAIESNLYLRVINEDFSGRLNKLLSETIPGFLAEHSTTINEYVTRLLYFIINLIL